MTDALHLKLQLLPGGVNGECTGVCLSAWPEVQNGGVEC